MTRTRDTRTRDTRLRDTRLRHRRHFLELGGFVHFAVGRQVVTRHGGRTGRTRPGLQVQSPALEDGRQLVVDRLGMFDGLALVPRPEAAARPAALAVRRETLLLRPQRLGGELWRHAGHTAAARAGSVLAEKSSGHVCRSLGRERGRGSLGGRGGGRGEDLPR